MSKEQEPGDANDNRYWVIKDDYGVAYWTLDPFPGVAWRRYGSLLSNRTNAAAVRAHIKEGWPGDEERDE